MKDLDFNEIIDKDIFKDDSIGSIDRVEDDFDELESALMEDELNNFNEHDMASPKTALQEEITEIYMDVYDKTEALVKSNMEKNKYSHMTREIFDKEAKPFLDEVSDKALDLFAEYFAIVDTEKELGDNSNILNTNDKIDKTELKNDKIAKIKKSYLANPFFVSFIKDLSPTEVADGDFDWVIKTYNDMEDVVLEETGEKQRPYLGYNMKKGAVSEDYIVEQCESTVELALDPINKKHRYEIGEVLDAVDLIVAHTLKSKAAKSMFFDKVRTKDGNQIDLVKFNEQVDEMRREIYNDPKFRKLMEDRVPRGQFYNEYRKLITNEIDNNISKQKQTEKRMELNAEYKTFANDYITNNEYMVSPERFEDIEKAYNELKRINEGKKPSEYMDKMMKSCETFIKEYKAHDGFVKGDVINAFNRASLKYYDKRKGVITGPVTGKGQARLKNVERILKNTSAMMSTVKADVKKAFDAKQKAKQIQQKKVEQQANGIRK